MKKHLHPLTFTIAIALQLFLNSLALQAQYLAGINKEFSLNYSLDKQRTIRKQDFQPSPIEKLGINSFKDTALINPYTHELMRDDPEYNKRGAIWKPFVEYTGFSVLLNLLDRSSSDSLLYFARTNPTTWKRTLGAGMIWSSGWEWDDDRFGNNFNSHPLTGAVYYNAARSEGYNYYAAFAYSFLGSYEWKMFGENGIPERNDIITTTYVGVLYGEIFYRISSNILDDQTTGSERVFREIIAGILDPMRGFNRLMQGKTKRVTTKEVYQKEPLNFIMYGGIHRFNNGSAFGTGDNYEMLDLQLDYGNPYEVRQRNIGDLFRLKVEFGNGNDRKTLNVVNAYMFLYGQSSLHKDNSILTGLFQSYDYYDNRAFELAAMGVDYGIIGQLKLPRDSRINYKFFLGAAPFGANSTAAGPDSTYQFRDYNFSGGADVKGEISFQLDKYGYFAIPAYYYWMHTYVTTTKEPEGLNFTPVPGNNFLGILRPRITLKLIRSLSVGFEHSIYYDDRYDKGFAAVHDVRTEQKLFLFLNIPDSKMRHHYNELNPTNSKSSL